MGKHITYANEQVGQLSDKYAKGYMDIKKEILHHNLHNRDFYFTSSVRYADEIIVMEVALRVIPYRSDFISGCGIDIDENFHVINRKGKEEMNIYALGILTDGKRNFNLYIPSPRSRLRAFLDVDHCVSEIIERGFARA